jgi:hypothetical protein
MRVCFFLRFQTKKVKVVSLLKSSTIKKQNNKSEFMKRNILLIISDLYTRVWDEADYVVPPAENGAFFVATNVIITPNQTRGEKFEIFCHC